MNLKKILLLTGLLWWVHCAYASEILIESGEKDSTILHIEAKNMNDLEAFIAQQHQSATAEGNTFQFSEVDRTLELNYRGSGAVWGGEENDDFADLRQVETDYKGNPKVQRAVDVFNAITEAKLLEKLTGSELVELPVGIRKKIGSTTATIMLASARLFPSYTQFEVICMVQMSDGRTLAFGSDNIKYSNEGGFIGDLTLGLYADFAFKKESPNIAITLKKFIRGTNGSNSTGCYVTFDCNGFIEMRIDGALHLSRNWVLPADQNGTPTGNGRVKADISVTATDFDDMVIQTSLPHFVLTKTPDVAFLVSGVVIDFSDKKCGDGFKLPPVPNVAPPGTAGMGQTMQQTSMVAISGEEEGGSAGATPPAPDPNALYLWKGVFIKNAEIIFPKTCNRKNNERLKAGVEYLYIDSKGVTGVFYVENPLPMGESKSGKWDFSIDRIDVTVVYSKVYQFSMAGRISPPVTDTVAPLFYKATANLEKKQYVFRADWTKKTVFPVLKTGEVTLLPGSFIKVEVVNDSFVMNASLSGSLSISVNNSTGSLEIASASFKKLLILSHKPFLSLDNNGGAFTLHQGASLNNSFINLSSASIIKSSDSTMMLALEMSADLMDEGGGAKTGGTFGIKGKMEEVNGKDKWKFDGLKLMALFVDISIGSHVRIAGEIRSFTNDPVYGNGFKGSLAGGFIKSGMSGSGNNATIVYKFNVVANMIFGSKPQEGGDPYKYWFFDVFVSSENWAVPLFAGIEANGFGGGAYHHMKMASFNPSLNPPAGGNPPPPGEAQNPSSGVVYVPNPTVQLGVKASMAIRSTGGGAFKGVVTFEMVFGAGMELQQVMFYGRGEITGDIGLPDISSRLDQLSAEREEAKTADKAASQQDTQDKIKAAFFIGLDFVDGFVMQGTFKAYMQAAKGKITGQGQVDLLINSKTLKWHLYVGGYTDNSVIDVQGNPLPPVQANVNFGPFNLTANFYLLTGNDIPGAPPIDPRVASFFGISQSGNNRALLTEGGRSPATGTGFAMGASIFLNLDVRDGKCGWVNKKDVYYKVDGGSGFDLSLLKYGDQSMCSLSGTTEHGAKRWRAGGRIWSYIRLQEGRGKLLGACLNLPSFQLGFMLDGDVPNPSVFQAYLKFSFLGLNINKKLDDLGTRCGTVVN